ncbi:MAG: hypothetical protein LUC22_01370 [Prevotella sp.]|nr:hypothetical protein [Prevotella sp.]
MKSKNTEERHMIVATCDPYHALEYYNGGKVLKKNMATPIEWIHDDCDGYGYSHSEALSLLEEYADHHLSWYFCDDEEIRELMQEIDEPVGADSPEWYEGPGWYFDDCVMYKRGDDSFTDDVMTYSIRRL